MTYGWRARVGYIAPADTLETPVFEFHRMAPDGVIMVASCLNINHLTRDSVDEAWARVAATAQSVAAYAVDVMFVGGAPLAFMKGPRAHAELAELVEKACSVRTITEMGSVATALRAVGATRLAVGSPFGASLNDPLVEFLEAEGFEIMAVEGLGCTSNAEITMLPLRTSYEVARKAFRKGNGADAVYIPCARWPVSPNIQFLEADLGVPVIASVQANLWSCLAAAGVSTKVTGYGVLLEGAD